MLISQEQLERMVEGAEAEIVDRHFTDRRHHPPGEAPSARTLSSQADVRRLLRAALAAAGVEVGGDPRLERHQAERREYQITERDVLGDFAEARRSAEPDLAVLRVVAETTCQAGPTTLFLADGSGHVYRVAAERL